MTNETTKTSSVEHVRALIAKAAGDGDSGNAMRFAQAALNAANALCALNSKPDNA